MRCLGLVAFAFMACSGLAACGLDGPKQGMRDGPKGEALGPGRGASVAVGDMFLFVGFDRDADYQVTFEEVNAGIGAVFEKADTDGNGSISQVEYGGWATLALGDAYAEPYFLHLDEDQNSLLSKSEFINSVYARARLYDKNQDNVLTFAELRPVLGRGGMPGAGDDMKQRRRGGRGPGGGRRGGGRFPGGGMPGGDNW